MFNKNNLIVSYKTTNYYHSKLKNMDHKTEKMSCSGIYKLKCECGAQYVGKSQENLNSVFKDTDIALFTINPKNQILQHIC